MATDGLRYPKDFTLGGLTLLTPVTTFEMKDILVELSYHEDIYNNTASGYLMVQESVGYIEKLNLCGNEYIRMTFGKTSEQFNWIDKLFRVYKVDKRKLEGNMYTESYCLYFCSEEMILSEQYKICKAYHKRPIASEVKGEETIGKDDGIINNILTQYLKVPTSKLAYIDKTYGMYDFVIPNRKPFDAINWLSTYARPTPDKPGADMLFFENKNGFNFVSLQTLMSSPVYYNYSYNPKNTNPQDINAEFRNVTTYEVLNSYDVLGGINSGAFANSLISADPLTRTVSITDFNYTQNYAQNAKSLNQYPVVNNFTNRFGNGVSNTSRAVLKLVFSNPHQQDNAIIKGVPSVGNDIFAETYIPWRTAQLALANYTRVKISVPGDPGLTAGIVISFSLLSRDPKNKTLDKNLSGNYLVSAVRHIINFNEYKTVLEITKESVNNQYADPSNSSTLWQNAAKGIY